jgi:ketosteroid isomerase-like protein
MGTTTKQDTQPTEVIRAVYEAFGRRDIAGLLDLFAPDIVISQSQEVPWGGTYRGHDEALEFLGKLGSHIETSIDIDRLIVAGDTVVEIGRTCVQAVESGREFAIDEIHVWRVRDGKVVRMEAYVDNAAMLSALRPAA